MKADSIVALVLRSVKLRLKVALNDSDPAPTVEVWMGKGRDQKKLDLTMIIV